ncbi:phosphonates import ATP-binding protein PhnC 2 [Terrihabitans soli]|uniref:Phosphonates import ATP-binding protein PhnC 2 n=1 Tax=Terrihabitans soli TaxID=708113 RepID=A0A6S6QQY8_9HYPH|nr:ATP-binding cassette domain-containing protein [Terrihabitans soli]BCJ89682.1 phosphonates import ATP-binding protein PhnC 2 [Terrihabitans soli]
MSLAFALDESTAPALNAPVQAAVEIRVRALAAGYRTRGPVFSDIGFDIARGERVALVGSNGAGKSTLLKTLMGFVAPLDGSVEIFGEEINAMTPSKLRGFRSKIGFVAQKHNLVSRLSVLSNVIHGTLGARSGPSRWVQALAPQQVRARALAALDQVGLVDLALRRADCLSGGQSQRVAIARALVNEPRLILADEPVASLDPAAGEDVMQVFEEVTRAAGATLVFTTHNLDHATRYAGRVLGLCSGGMKIDSAVDKLPEGGLRGLYS